MGLDMEGETRSSDQVFGSNDRIRNPSSLLDVACICGTRVPESARYVAPNEIIWRSVRTAAACSCGCSESGEDLFAGTGQQRGRVDVDIPVPGTDINCCSQHVDLPGRPGNSGCQHVISH